MFILGFTVLKGIFIKLASQAFLEWLLFWAVDMLVKSTKTTKDDEFFKKVKEIVDEQS